MEGWNYFHHLGMCPIGLVEVQHIENNVLYMWNIQSEINISFGFISFWNITWVSYKLKLKFFGRYLVPKHKVSNMSAINNIEFKTTIKVKSYFDDLN